MSNKKKLNPTFFLIVINTCLFDSKYQAVKYMKIIRQMFQGALIKMVESRHQEKASFVKNQKIDLKLWGCGRIIRDRVFKILEKNLP